MATYHKVKQGEYLASIAANHGISPQAVWADPANAKLQQKRENPDVLYPGDRIAIPDKSARTESGATENRHRFRFLGRRVMLRIVVEDSNAEPMADTDCTLVAGSAVG